MSRFRFSARKACDSKVRRTAGRSRRLAAARGAFTLIELLVAISIIGLLAALALGGMYKADVSAKQLNSKTTVNKIAVQINEIWESYRTRKLPIDVKQVLLLQGAAPYTVQYANAINWLTYFSTVRTTVGATAIYPDTTPAAFNGTNPNNNLQVAALRLAATRELMRLEMPDRFSDFTSSASGTAPSSAAPVQTLLIPQPLSGGVPIANPGGLSEQYRQFFMSHATTFNDSYQSAECLYMIIKFASQNELGQKNITDDPRLVGDSDGDGMPEIQDAFNCSVYTPALSGTAYTQHHMPISFIRWPVGFLSDLQPGPNPSLSQATGSWSTTVEYAALRHDIYDPLRIDPRAFITVPLVYSAGVSGAANAPYSDYDIWEGHVYTGLTGNAKLLAQNDPYYTKALTPIFPLSQNMALEPLPGTQMDPGTNWPGGSIGTGAYADNITNHLLTTSRQ